MEERKLYIGVKIGAEHEETVRGYLRNFNDLKAFEVLETVDPQRLHVTLAFLGNRVDAAQGERILRAGVSGVAPFDAFVGEAMSFGSSVLLLRVYGSGLMVLNKKLVEAGNQELNGRFDKGYRKYVPHLTLAKNEAGRRDGSHDVTLGIAALACTPMMPFTVDRVGLYHKSELLCEVPLGA